jgi:hypothetical protein
MESERSPEAVLRELAEHPKGDDLARLVHTLAFAAADERRAGLDQGLEEAASRAGITRDDSETSFGNVLRSLERAGSEGAGAASRVLLAALLGRGVALSPPKGNEAEERVADSLLWIGAHTPIDALSGLDAALGSSADGIWFAVGAVLRRIDEGKAPLAGRAEALVGAAGLRASVSPAAKAEVKALATDLRDPIARSLLGVGEAKAPLASDPAVPAQTISGELVPAPRGPVALALLGVTGVLAAMHLARVVGRWALRYRAPAELRVDGRGVTIVSKTEMLGRVLREREVHIPREGLSRATRDVRYPRLPMYVGLLALAIGSYFGVSIFVEGARAASPELLGIGALLLGVGVTLDFVLGSIAGTTTGRCRVVFVPRRGAALAIGEIDRAQADAALGALQ